MSLPTYLLPQSMRGFADRTKFSEPQEARSYGQIPSFDASAMALNGGPPPVRVPRQFRLGLSGWNGVSQWATPQQADGLASIRDNRFFINLSPAAIPRRPALQGIGAPLAQVGQSMRLSLPSVFVPVAGLKG